MRIRIRKTEFNIAWEYLVAPLLILLALTILLAWKLDHEKGETIRIAASQTPAISERPVQEIVPGDDDRYDMPDADDEESKPGKEPQGPFRINVNKASMEELMSLPYIGEVKARAIIAYREAHGPFKTPEELLNVKGIGPKTLERLRDYIVFE